MNLINCTPHAIRVVRENGEVLEIPPSGISIRVDTAQEVVGEIDGIPVVKTVFKSVQLPDPQENTVYIVSTVVLQAVKELGIYKGDLVAPDTGPGSVIRDANGQVVGIRRFQVL